MVASLLAYDPTRLPGCSERCHTVRVIQAGTFGRRDLTVHDPEDHELYGRQMAGDHGAFAILETGTLAIDRHRCLVLISGQPVPLSATEFKIVLALGDRFDRVVPYEHLVARVWGAEFVSTLCHTLVATNLNRIRAKLGPTAAGLIETRINIGLRLRSHPVGQPCPYVHPHEIARNRHAP